MTRSTRMMALLLALVLAWSTTSCGTEARGSVVVKDGNRYELTLDSGRRLVVEDFEILVDGVSHGKVEEGQRVELFGGGDHDGQVFVDGERRPPVLPDGEVPELGDG